MSKSKQTKKALLSSVIALILCFSMLLGTTFAWFTDTVESGINKIQAGNLDIDVTTADGVSIEDVTTLFNDVKLWEPGAVAYEKLTISNEGSLALKYAMSFAWDKENNLNGHKLSDVLKVAVLEADVVAGLNMEDRNAVVAAAEKASNGDLKTFGVSGALYPVENAEAGEFTEREIHVVIYWMPGENDNLYNANNGQTTSDGEALHIDLGVVVKATQQMKEEDSFGDDYDEKAEYPENAWLGDATYDWYTPNETEYTLTYASDLAGFANLVNGTAPANLARGGETHAAVNFAGCTIKLADSIDLNNLPWTPIGINGNYFAGTFDGDGKTIYNLNVDTAKQSGLFANVRGTLKNVTIWGATVRSNDYAGALLGQGYGKIENCHAVNVDVIATPVLKDGEYDGGAKAGGLVGQLCEGNLWIKNCTVTNAYVRAYRDVGGLVGMAHYGTTVSGNTVTDATVAYIAAEDYAPYDGNTGNENLSTVVGRIGLGAPVTIENNTVVGAHSVASVEEFAALVVGEKDKTIDIALQSDLELDADNTLTLVEGAIVNLDLNGYTITAVTDDADENDDGKITSVDNEVVIDVRGTLSVKNGTMTIKHESDNLYWNGCTEIFYVGFNGTLNVENATLENLGGSDMAYAIDVVNAKNATLNVTNSTIKSTYIAVRIFNNSSTGMNNVTIKESNIIGVSRALWVHIYTDADTNGKGIRDNTLNLDIFGNGNNYVGTNPNRLIEFGFTDPIRFNGEGALVVSDAATMGETLKDGGDVVLNDDIQMEAENTAPYGNKYGVALNGGTLDGNGNKLDIECYGDDYGVMTTGGTIKNITIDEGCRAVMIMYATQDIILDNVNIGGDGVLYPINTGEYATVAGVDLIVTNSTLAGWTSYAGIESASFTNVKFEQGTYYNNIYGRVLKPYVNTTLTDCSFVEHMNLDLSGLAEGQKVTFVNCTVNGQAVTADVLTIPADDAAYDTDLFTVDLPSWATSIADCIIFG